MLTDTGIDMRQFARSVGTVMHYGPNDFVFNEGDEPRFMYVVLSGEVEISSRGKLIETIHEGNALGIISLLDNQARTTTARAITPCEIALMDKKKFRYMVEEIPNFVWFVMEELAHRLRTTSAAL